MKKELLLADTTFFNETPEGVDLEICPAGPVVRGFAWGVDQAIRSFGYGLVAFIASIFGGAGTALSLILIFLVEWFYPVIFEVYRGATPGKAIFNLEVTQSDGSPLSWSSSLLRNLLRTADFFPFFYCAGLVSMVLNRRFQRLGDIAADTVVVYRKSDGFAVNLPKYPPAQPPCPLPLIEQRLIMDFAERGTRLSSARRAELASLVPYITGRSELEPELVLLSYANRFARGL